MDQPERGVKQGVRFTRRTSLVPQTLNAMDSRCRRCWGDQKPAVALLSLQPRGERVATDALEEAGPDEVGGTG